MELTEKIRGTGNVLIGFGMPGGRGFDELGESFFGSDILQKGRGHNGYMGQNTRRTRSFLWFDADIAGCTDAEQVKERL
jgi:hypothetical protein